MENALSVQVIEAFCDLCNDAYKGWLFHRCFFRRGFLPRHVKSPKAAQALIFISGLTQENFLHNVCKLHDPAIQNMQINLGIDYIVRFGAWRPPIKKILLDRQKKLNGFAERLRTVRNKRLSHNDLEALSIGNVLGDFPAGEDTLYFRELQKFVTIVSKEITDFEFTFDNNIAYDANALLELVADFKPNPKHQLK